jgi:hypothetical protein
MIRFEEYVGKDAKLSVKLGKQILFYDATNIQLDECWISFRDRFGNGCTFKKELVVGIREL